MPKQLVEPVSPCHATCVEYIWTNTPALKGQVTGSQTHSCQPSEQIWVCLNLQLKIWLQILSDQVLSLQQGPGYSKVKTRYRTHQDTTHPTSVRQLDTGFLQITPAASNIQHSEGNRELFINGNWQLMLLSLYLSTSLRPWNPWYQTCCQPPSTFSFCHSCALPGLLHHTCFLTLVLLHQKPWDGGGSRMTNTSTLCCNTNTGGGRCYARVGGGISSGQSINCVALPAHPTFVSVFCWNTCKLVIAEVFLAAKP